MPGERDGAAVRPDGGAGGGFGTPMAPGPYHGVDAQRAAESYVREFRRARRNACLLVVALAVVVTVVAIVARWSTLVQLLVLLAVLVPVVVAYARGFGRRAALARSILVSDCDPQRYRAFVACVLQLDAKLMSRQVVPAELAACDLFEGEYERASKGARAMLATRAPLAVRLNAAEVEGAARRELGDEEGVAEADATLRELAEGLRGRRGLERPVDAAVLLSHLRAVPAARQTQEDLEAIQDLLDRPVNELQRRGTILLKAEWLLAHGDAGGALACADEVERLGACPDHARAIERIRREARALSRG